MKISETLLPEFDQETAKTRKTLERVPKDKWDWKPHDKSMSFGELATHLATIPTWAATTINEDSFDVAPGGSQPQRVQAAASPEEMLQSFDKSVKEAREAIAKASDDRLLKPWSLLMDGRDIFTLPRIAVLRSFVISHAIHHRAQLGVYLRLNDVPVPATYGPSADEEAM